MQEEIFMYQKYKWKIIKMHINKNVKISSRVDPRRALIKDNPKLYKKGLVLVKTVTSLTDKMKNHQNKNNFKDRVK